MTHRNRRWFLANTAKAMASSAALLTLGDLLPAMPLQGAGEPPVPPAYTDLAFELAGRMRQAISFFGSRRFPPIPDLETTYAASLYPANSNLFTRLLSEKAFPMCVSQLDAFEKLGVNGVHIQIGYPLLDPTFQGNELYLDFYRRVAAEVKRRGMTLAIECGILVSRELVQPTDVNSYFASRTAHVQLIAQHMAPDYLSFGNEPTVEQVITRLEFDVPRYTRFINQTLEVVPRGTIKYCAGTGSWDDFEYWSSFMTDTSIDCGDLHIFPLATTTTNYLSTASQMIDEARANGKEVISTQASLFKASAQEVSDGIDSTSVLARDVFNFWIPYDSQYLRMMEVFSQAKGMKFMAYHFTKWLHQSYIPYNEETKDYDYQTGQRVADGFYGHSLEAQTFSQTGLTLARIAQGLEPRPTSFKAYLPMIHTTDTGSD